MIIWSGRGILSVLVLIALFIVLIPFSDKLGDYQIIVTIFGAAVFSWLLGRKWNKKIVFIDTKSERVVEIKNKHRLFWIPMQIWAIIFSAVGLILLFAWDRLIEAALCLAVFAFLLFVNHRMKKSVEVYRVDLAEYNL